MRTIIRLCIVVNNSCELGNDGRLTCQMSGVFSMDARYNISRLHFVCTTMCIRNDVLIRV